MSESPPNQKRGIKSFVLRQGRLTPGQRNALEQLWPLYGLNSSDGFIEPVTLFDRSAPLVLEIGFGMGDSLVSQAEAAPGSDFIGIEVHRPGVGHLLMGMKDKGCQNIRVFAEDSLDVLQLSIPDCSLDVLQLFFPDPWPKKKHHKRRIVNRDFVSTLRQKLKPDGLFHFATDWAPYAEAVEELFSEIEGFEAVTAPSRPETKFERRGEKLGHKIFDLAYRITPRAAADH